MGDGAGLLSAVYPARPPCEGRAARLEQENTYRIMLAGSVSGKQGKKCSEGFMWTVSKPGTQSKVVVQLDRTDTAHGVEFTFEKVTSSR
ncbi:hypothetical protein GCM10010372_51820 [Streptomyces tauricus]|uniref:hypothetical protein n=1 Tax=Streptomyces tauricus TaxID=68274 RepID=UPI001674BCBE|nr:hypothetical protein [Streptomyces tauricus]MCW8103074.1 hypothetical protein [Streptomyces tauricus]GHA45470.1 hypothetical protein GCM10010372_51820 [Streptomyces tauricus]